MKRRDFVSLVTAAMGTSLLYSCRKDWMYSEAASNLDITAARGGGGGVVTRNPLKIPTVVQPSGLNLTAAPGISDLVNTPGKEQNSSVWQYNGSFAGPTIRANAGSTATITLHNGLPEESITHWHGMIVNPANDGTPLNTIPGAITGSPAPVYEYNFPINQRAFLGFYHPHPHMLTGKQVYKGLSGAFIVTDAEEAGLGLPSDPYEVPLLIRDATLDAARNLVYKPTAGGFFGKIPLVNGTKDPYLKVQKAVYRFRIVNGSNSRIYDLNLGNGQSMILIGNDGGLLELSSNQSLLTIANGERLDILIDFRGLNDGTKVMLRDSRSGWNLLEFQVTGSTIVSYNGPPLPQPNSPLPLNISPIVKLSNPVITREFSFDAMSKINGREYDMDRIDWTVPFGQTERWRFKSNGNAPHPVHVHGASFQVQSRTGGRGQLFPWENGWKDTVLLEDQETVDVFVRFDSYTGTVPNKGIYVMHCHKLEHEDMGMMANFEVV